MFMNRDSVELDSLFCHVEVACYSELWSSAVVSNMDSNWPTLEIKDGGGCYFQQLFT